MMTENRNKARKEVFFDIIQIIIGIVLAGFGLKGFLLPNGFVDGGATGISLLISGQTGVTISLMIVIVNIPFFLVGLKIIGRQLVFKALVSIAGLALCLAFIPYPTITNDKLLVAIFGGFFLGAGIGLTIRGGSVIDGSEILAIAISKKLGMTIGDIILVFNIFIFSAAAYLLSVETALYSILIYLAASKTVDFIIDGIEEYTSVTIVSDYWEEVRNMLTNELGHGVTIFNGLRGFTENADTGDDRNLFIIYTVVTRLEINRLRRETEKIDPKAFIIMNSVKDTKGGMIKKKRMAG